MEFYPWRRWLRLQDAVVDCIIHFIEWKNQVFCWGHCKTEMLEAGKKLPNSRRGSTTAMTWLTMLPGGRLGPYLFCLLFIAMVNVCWSNLPISYVVVSTVTTEEQPFDVGPSTIMPKIGVEVRLANGEALSNATYATVLFHRPRTKVNPSSQGRGHLSQLFVNQSGFVRVPGVRCSFAHPDGSPASSGAWCTDAIWEAPANEGITDGGGGGIELLAMTVVFCASAPRGEATCRPMSESILAIQSATAIVFVETFEFQAEGPGLAGEARPLSRRIQIIPIPLDDSVLLRNQLHLTKRRIIRRDLILHSSYGGQQEDIVFSNMELTEIRKRGHRTGLLQSSVHLSRSQQVVKIEPSRGWLDALLLLGAVKAVLDLIWILPMAFRRFYLFLIPPKKIARPAKKGSWALSSLPLTPRSKSLNSALPPPKGFKLLHCLGRTARHSSEGLPLLDASLSAATAVHHSKGAVDIGLQHKRSQSLPLDYETSHCQSSVNQVFTWSRKEAEVHSRAVLESPPFSGEDDDDSLTPKISEDLSSNESIWTHSNPIFSPSPCDILSSEVSSTASFNGRSTKEKPTAMAGMKLSYGDDWLRCRHVILPQQAVKIIGGGEETSGASGPGSLAFSASALDKISSAETEFENCVDFQKKELMDHAALNLVAVHHEKDKDCSNDQSFEKTNERLEFEWNGDPAADECVVVMSPGPESAQIETMEEQGGEIWPRDLPISSMASGGCLSNNGQKQEKSESEFSTQCGNLSTDGAPEGEDRGNSQAHGVHVMGIFSSSKGKGCKAWARYSEDCRGGRQEQGEGNVRFVDRLSSSFNFPKGFLGTKDEGLGNGVSLSGSWKVDRSYESVDWELASEASYVSVCSVSSKASDGPERVGRRKGRDVGTAGRREKGSDGRKRAAWGSGPGLRNSMRSVRSSTGSIKFEGLSRGRSGEGGEVEPLERRSSGSQVVGRALAMAGLKAPKSGPGS